MKYTEISQLSTAELEKKEKQLKKLIGFFVGMLIVLLAANVLLFFIEKEIRITSMVIFLAFTPIFFMNLNNIKKLREEINSRQQENSVD